MRLLSNSLTGRYKSTTFAELYDLSDRSILVAYRKNSESSNMLTGHLNLWNLEMLRTKSDRSVIFPGQRVERPRRSSARFCKFSSRKLQAGPRDRRRKNFKKVQKYLDKFGDISYVFTFRGRASTDFPGGSSHIIYHRT
jgi:hypothetical protein